MSTRIIKFRAWLPKVKIMLEEVTLYPDMIGMYSEQLDEITKDKKLIIDDDCIRDSNDEHLMNLLPGEDWYWIESGNFEVMQFTGLLDKNGKEIYEGDIIKFQKFANWDDDGEFPRHIASVIFEKGGFCWQIIKEGHQGYYSANEIDHLSKTNSTWGLEVIGNIYSNPELCKP